MKHRSLPQIPTEPVTTSCATAEIVRDVSRPSHVMLLLDGVESSALDLDDPEYLDFEYMQHIRLIVESRLVPGEARERHPRILHLGGAGCALARSLGTRQALHQVAVEIDAELARLVREWFALPPAPFLKIRVGEARTVLDSATPTWNVIVRDAFADRRVPRQLLTAECAARAAECLLDGGLYIVNAVASAGRRVLDEDIAAIAGAFPYTLAIADPAVFSGKRFGNIIIAGSAEPFDAAVIERAVRALPLPARCFDDAELRRRAQAVTALTDSLVPWPSPDQVS